MKKLMMVALLAVTAGTVLAANPESEKAGDAMTVDVTARAGTTVPVGVALAAPLQWPDMDSDVTCFRFGLFFARNAAVSGFDLSTVANEHSFAGCQLTLFGWTSGRVRGCLLGGLANVAAASVDGYEMALANVTHGDFRGFQLGAVDYNGSFAGMQVAGLLNWNNLGSRGFQVGLVNADQVKFTGCALGAVSYSYELLGLQLGGVNLAEECTGVQLGLINACDTLHGVQIGLLNVISTSPAPILPVANAWF